MIVMRIMAGLGNQLFQYAFARNLKESGQEVYLDITSYQTSPVHNGFELEHLFSINIPYARKEQIDKTCRFLKDLNIPKRISRKLHFLFNLPYPHITEKKFGVFNPVLLKLKGDFYLEGYWQSESYFKPIERIIRQEFVFKEPLNEQNENFIQIMNSVCTVSVHVRRGDMLNHPLHGNICTKAYYDKAIALIKNNVSHPQFCFFSDDISWCRSAFPELNAWFVDWNTGAESYKDMLLMSHCKHHIIANSSFSWWGAWLNPDPQKIVIAPEKWLNGNYNPVDLLPKDWKKIPVNG